MKTLRLTSLGFTRDEAMDFGDDGNYFKGYNYKGVPVSYLRQCGEIYLSFRLDYLKNPNNVKTWNDDTDRFNGVSPDQVTKEALLETAEKVLAFAKENGFVLANSVRER